MIIEHEFWMQCYTGLAFDFLDPKPEQVSLEDVAHHLATAAIRFNGATGEPYSVAQHSVWVADYLRAIHAKGPHALVLNPYTGEEKLADRSPHLEMLGLMHDTPEAYTGDMVRPWKRLLWVRAPGSLEDEYVSDCEDRYLHAILQALAPELLVKPRAPFGWIREFDKAHVKAADNAALETEHRDLLVEPPQGWVKTGIDPWGPEIVPLPWRDAKDLFLHRYDQLKTAMEAAR